MKNFIILCAGLLFLTGCPSEQEVKETTEGLLEKKTIASNSINSNDFSLEGLLKTHDYFFDFGEKVHLMKEDEKSVQQDEIAKLKSDSEDLNLKFDKVNLFLN